MDAIQLSIYKDCIHSTYGIAFVDLDNLSEEEILYIFNNIGDGSIPQLTFVTEPLCERIYILNKVDGQLVHARTRQRNSAYFANIQEAMKYEAGFREWISTSSNATESNPLLFHYTVEETEVIDLWMWLLWEKYPNQFELLCSKIED
jgi:hypothetical protein